MFESRFVAPLEENLPLALEPIQQGQPILLPADTGYGFVIPLPMDAPLRVPPDLAQAVSEWGLALDSPYRVISQMDQLPPVALPDSLWGVIRLFWPGPLGIDLSSLWPSDQQPGEPRPGEAREAITMPGAHFLRMLAQAAGPLAFFGLYHPQGEPIGTGELLLSLPGVDAYPLFGSPAAPIIHKLSVIGFARGEIILAREGTLAPALHQEFGEQP